MGSRTTEHRAAHATTGLLAAVAGMAAGHLVAGVLHPPASPVLAVSAAVIRLTPETVKQWAVRTFGDADKAVLVGSVTVVVLLLSLVTGRASRARPAVGLTAVGLLGVVSAIAAVTSPAVTSASDAGPVATVAPVLAAVVVAAGVLLGLRRRLVGGRPFIDDADDVDVAAETPSSPVGDDDRSPVESPTDHAAVGHVPGAPARRRFLVGAAGVAGGSVVAGLVGHRLARPGAVDDLDGIAIDSPAPRLPTGLDREVPGITPFRTPIPDFYRVDTALTIPRLDRDSWTLTIDGDVEQRLDLSFRDLVEDFDVIERDVTLSCVSNEVGGPYVSSGRWLGVRTSDVLARAGVGSTADQILSRSSDGMTISTPIRALTDDRESMIAIGLDGEALPRERGYPARLLTPGLYGFVGATKWLVRLTATTYARDAAYWTRRDWATDAPVKTQSRIDTPKAFATIAPGPLRIGGVAWAQRRGITRVEVRVDDGPWQPAELGPEANVDYWRQWYHDVELAEPGRHDIEIRATDGTGEVQTAERTPPFPDGASGRASVVVRVE